MRGNEFHGYFDLGLLQVSFDAWSHDVSVAPKFIRAKPGKESAALIQTCQGDGTHSVVSTPIWNFSLGYLIGGFLKEVDGYTASLHHVPREWLVGSNGRHPLRP